MGCRNQQVSAHRLVPWRGHFSLGPSDLEQVCSCCPVTGPRGRGPPTGGGDPHRGSTSNQLQNQAVLCLLLPTAPARPLGGDTPRNGARCRDSGLHRAEKAPECFPSRVLFTRLSSHPSLQEAESASPGPSQAVICLADPAGAGGKEERDGGCSGKLFLTAAIEGGRSLRWRYSPRVQVQLHRGGTWPWWAGPTSRSLIFSQRKAVFST